MVAITRLGLTATTGQPYAFTSGPVSYNMPLLNASGGTVYAFTANYSAPVALLNATAGAIYAITSSKSQPIPLLNASGGTLRALFQARYSTPIAAITGGGSIYAFVGVPVGGIDVPFLNTAAGAIYAFTYSVSRAMPTFPNGGSMFPPATENDDIVVVIDKVQNDTLHIPFTVWVRLANSTYNGKVIVRGGADRDYRALEQEIDFGDTDGEHAAWNNTLFDKGGPHCGATWVGHTYTTVGLKTINVTIRNPGTGTEATASTTVTPIAWTSETTIYYDETYVPGTGDSPDGTSAFPWNTWAALVTDIKLKDPADNADAPLRIFVRMGTTIAATGNQLWAGMGPNTSRVQFQGDWEAETGDAAGGYAMWDSSAGVPFDFSDGGGTAHNWTFQNFRYFTGDHALYAIHNEGAAAPGNAIFHFRTRSSGTLNSEKAKWTLSNFKGHGKLIGGGGGGGVAAPTGGAVWGVSPVRYHNYTNVETFSASSSYTYGFCEAFEAISFVNYKFLHATPFQHQFRLMGLNSGCFWGFELGDNDGKVRNAADTSWTLGDTSWRLIGPEKYPTEPLTFHIAPTQDIWAARVILSPGEFSQPIEFHATAGSGNPEHGWIRYIVFDNPTFRLNWWRNYGTASGVNPPPSLKRIFQTSADNVYFFNPVVILNPSPMGGFNGESTDFITLNTYYNHTTATVTAAGGGSGVTINAPATGEEYHTLVLEDGSHWMSAHNFPSWGQLSVSGTASNDGEYWFLHDPYSTDTLRVYAKTSLFEDYSVLGNFLTPALEVAGTFSASRTGPHRPHNIWVQGLSIFGEDAGNNFRIMHVETGGDNNPLSFAGANDPLTGDIRFDMCAGRIENGAGVTSRILSFSGLNEDIVATGRVIYNNNIWSANGGNEGNWITQSGFTNVTTPPAGSLRVDPQFMGPYYGEQRIVTTTSTGWGVGDRVYGLESLGSGRIKAISGTQIDVQYISTHRPFQSGMDDGAVSWDGNALDLYNKDAVSHAVLSTVTALRDDASVDAAYTGEDLRVTPTSPAIEGGPTLNIVTTIPYCYRDFNSVKRPGFFGLPGVPTIGAFENPDFVFPLLGDGILHAFQVNYSVPMAYLSAGGSIYVPQAGSAYLMPSLNATNGAQYSFVAGYQKPMSHLQDTGAYALHAFTFTYSNYDMPGITDGGAGAGAGLYKFDFLLGSDIFQSMEKLTDVYGGGRLYPLSEVSRRPGVSSSGWMRTRRDRNGRTYRSRHRR